MFEIQTFLHFLILFSCYCGESSAGSIAQSVSSLVGRRQIIGIRGQLLCGTEPLTNTTVKLWDEDSGPDPDDLLAEGLTNATGHFSIYGAARELTNIDPKFKIYHRCHVKEGGCKRKVTFVIPDNYISVGNKLEKWFEFGSLNMEIITRKEGTQCF
ncbi:unnamed protein product [Auanema sp. JU1783]|nr:unnamed protein product [Auanema sp. JU1783]